MILSRRSFVVLIVAGSLAWTGCQPAIQPPAGNQDPDGFVQKQGSPQIMQVKADENIRRVQLLMVDTVQKDLGLTAEQIGKLRDFARANLAQWDVGAAKAQELSPSGSFSLEESDKMDQALRAFSDDWNRKAKEARTRILSMLTAIQIERLKQIQLQATPSALARPDVVKALDISEEQLARISALVDDMVERIAQKQLAASSDLPAKLNTKESRQKVKEFERIPKEPEAETTVRVLAVLTPEQRAKWDQMQGKKVDLSGRYDALIPEDGGL